MSNLATVLERMASNDLNKEMESAGCAGLPASIQAALREQLEEEQKTAAKRAAKEIVNLIKAHDTTCERYVKTIRNLRKQEKEVKDCIDTLNRAKAYGIETGNFLPLARVTGYGIYHQVENKELLKIPEGWTPTPAEKAE